MIHPPRLASRVTALFLITALWGALTAWGWDSNHPFPVAEHRSPILSDQDDRSNQKKPNGPEADQKPRLGVRDTTGRADALKRFGGNRETERAVADGLAWLAAHQRPDGVWDRRNFDRLCPSDDRCGHTSLHRHRHDCDVGVSALAALAFLGAGYTHERGEYARNLTKVFEFILAQQDASGSFSSTSGQQIYNDALATFAIAEAAAMTADRVFDEPLRRAVRHLERSQQAEGGWDYTANTLTRRCDTSITGWVLMALKSAQAAGVECSLDTRFRLVEHFDRATESDGHVWYANDGTGTSYDLETGRRNLRYGPAMTAVGLYARSALGLRLDEPAADRQVSLLTGELPDLKRMYSDRTNLHSDYYWYYGTLALFNHGGAAWDTWNQSLRRSVLEYQERPVRKTGKKRHAYGSWPAYGKDWGKWGRAGSRIYSTALNVLTLEIYYRYTPAFLSPRGLIGPLEIRRRLEAADPDDAVEVLRLTVRLHPDTAEPILPEFLDSGTPGVRLAAALALARHGSPLGAAELTGQRESAGGQARQEIDAALAGLSRVKREFDCGQITEASSAARMFLFDTAGQPLYYGQAVIVLRDGRPVTRAIVNRRFTAQRAAAARVDGETFAVRVGDTVTTRMIEDAPDSR
jgi:hypothetical protein